MAQQPQSPTRFPPLSPGAKQLNGSGSRGRLAAWFAPAPAASSSESDAAASFPRSPPATPSRLSSQQKQPHLASPDRGGAQGGAVAPVSPNLYADWATCKSSGQPYVRPKTPLAPLPSLPALSFSPPPAVKSLQPALGASASSASIAKPAQVTATDGSSAAALAALEAKDDDEEAVEDDGADADDADDEGDADGLQASLRDRARSRSVVDWKDDAQRSARVRQLLEAERDRMATAGTDGEVSVVQSGPTTSDNSDGSGRSFLPKEARTALHDYFFGEDDSWEDGFWFICRREYRCWVLTRSAEALITRSMHRLVEYLLAAPTQLTSVVELHQRLRAALVEPNLVASTIAEAERAATHLLDKDNTPEGERKLDLPVLPAAVLEWPGGAKVAEREVLLLQLTAVLEHLTEAWWQLCCETSVHKRTVSERVVRRSATLFDEAIPTLLQLGLAADFRLDAHSATEGGFPDWRMHQLFPRAQARVRELNERYAWYHRKDETEAVLRRWMAGELEPSALLQKAHVRPVAWLGRLREPSVDEVDRFVPRETHQLQAHSDSSSSDEDKPDPVERAFDVVAFDLLDAEEKEYPLLLEFRSGDNEDCPASGTLRARHTGQLVGRIGPTDRGEAVLQLCGVKQESWESDDEDGFFASFALHGLKDDNELEFGAVSSARFLCNCDLDVEPDEADDAHDQKWFELEKLCAAAAKLAADGFGKEMESAGFTTQYKLNHPPAVVRQFSLARLRAAWDSADVQAAVEGLHMPDDLLSLIGEYAPADLPFVPLDTLTRAARLTKHAEVVAAGEPHPLSAEGSQPPYEFDFADPDPVDRLGRDLCGVRFRAILEDMQPTGREEKEARGDEAQREAELAQREAEQPSDDSIAAADVAAEAPENMHAPSGVQRFSTLFSLPGDVTTIVVLLDGSSIAADAAALDSEQRGAEHLASLLPADLRAVEITLDLDTVHECPTASKQLLLDTLSHVPKMRALELTLHAGMMDRALQPAPAVSRLAQLRRLRLDAQLSVPLVDSVAGLEQLEFLDVNNGMWPTQPLRRLVDGPCSRLDRLSELALHNQVLQSSALDALAQLPSLRVLRPKMIVSDAFSELGTALPHLTALSLLPDSDSNPAPFGEAQIAAQLSKLTQLEDLELAQVALSEADLSALLASVQRARSLSFERCTFPDGLDALRAAPVSLTALSFTGVKSAVRAAHLLPLLRELPALRQLTLHVPAAEVEQTKAELAAPEAGLQHITQITVAKQQRRL